MHGPRGCMPMEQVEEVVVVEGGTGIACVVILVSGAGGEAHACDDNAPMQTQQTEAWRVTFTFARELNQHPSLTIPTVPEGLKLCKHGESEEVICRRSVCCKPFKQSLCPKHQKRQSTEDCTRAVPETRHSLLLKAMLFLPVQRSQRLSQQR